MSLFIYFIWGFSQSKSLEKHDALILNQQLIYNVVLVSGIQQRESYVHFFSQIIFPHKPSQDIEQSSLYYTAGSCQLSIFCIVLCICQYQFPNLSFPSYSLSFPGASGGKESAWNTGYLHLIPGFERPPGGGHGNPLQYACLKNPHGQRCLVVYSPWGCKESDMAERLSTAPYSLVTIDFFSLHL